jgi:hypothetical protein
LCKSLRCSYPTLLLKRTIYRDFGVEEICLFFVSEKGVFLQWLPSTREASVSIIRPEVQSFPHSYCERLRWCVHCRGSQRTIVSIANKRWFFIKLFGWRVGFEYPIVRYRIVYCLSTLAQDCTCVSHCPNGSFEKDPVTQAFRVTYTIQERSGRSCDVSGDVTKLKQD